MIGPGRFRFDLSDPRSSTSVTGRCPDVSRPVWIRLLVLAVKTLGVLGAGGLKL